MKAIAYQQSLPIENDDALKDVTLADPQPGPFDLLVEVRAISVNPIDVKVRRRSTPAPGEWKVLGWDVAGVVRAVGAEVSLFVPGDEVFYAGSLARPGCNSELHVVDERLVGMKPATLSFAEAAALPLTSLTAYEMLFDRFNLPFGSDSEEEEEGESQNILIIGGGGGVGSMAIQLARQLTDVTVTATAGHDLSRRWVEEMGAHHVINHRNPLAHELKELGISSVDYVFCISESARHWADICQLIAPQGHIGLIDDPADNLDIRPLKSKSVAIHWESMFTRSSFSTGDVANQGLYLNDIAQWVDDELLRTTMRENLGAINAHNLRQAHAILENGKAVGKIVLEGF